MQKPINVKIDTTNDESVISYNNIRKGDTLLMTFKVFQGSQSLNLTGQTMHIVLQKPDGFAVEKIASSVTGNMFQVAFDVQATLAVGDVEGIVEISDVNGTDITNTFTFEVKKNPSSSIVINSKNEIETLSQISGLIAAYNGNADNLAIQNNLALANISTLKNDIVTSNTLDVALKNDIVVGTPLDVALKSDISIGQALDILLKSDISTGNAVNSSLITSIANGNEVIANLLNANWPSVWKTIQEILSFYELITKGTMLTDGNGNYLTDGNGNYLTM